MVREAVINDVKRIIEIGNTYNPNFFKIYDFKEILEETYSRVFVFEENNRVKGFIHIIELYESVDIQNIVVDNQEQKKGIATLLMDYMFSSIGGEVKTITLEVAISNKIAQRLYNNFGFEKINERKSYYKNENAYLMAKQVR